MKSDKVKVPNAEGGTLACAIQYAQTPSAHQWHTMGAATKAQRLTL